MWTSSHARFRKTRATQKWKNLFFRQWIFPDRLKSLKICKKHFRRWLFRYSDPLASKNIQIFRGSLFAHRSLFPAHGIDVFFFSRFQVVWIRKNSRTATKNWWNEEAILNSLLINHYLFVIYRKYVFNTKYRQSSIVFCIVVCNWIAGHNHGTWICSLDESIWKLFMPFALHYKIYFCHCEIKIDNFRAFPNLFKREKLNTRIGVQITYLFDFIIIYS